MQKGEVMKRKRKACLRKPVSWLLAFALAIGLAIPQAAVYAGEPGSMDGVPAQFEEVYEPGLGSESAESYSSGEEYDSLDAGQSQVQTADEGDILEAYPEQDSSSAGETSYDEVIPAEEGDADLPSEVSEDAVTADDGGSFVDPLSGDGSGEEGNADLPSEASEDAVTADDDGSFVDPLSGDGSGEEGDESVLSEPAEGTPATEEDATEEDAAAEATSEEDAADVDAAAEGGSRETGLPEEAGDTDVSSEPSEAGNPSLLPADGSVVPDAAGQEETAAEAQAAADGAEGASSLLSTPEVQYRDGTYEGSGNGRNGVIVMAVTIEEGRIAKIEAVSQNETDEYWNEAVKMTDAMIEAQTADVDMVTGATRSSEGILQAVRNALDKALVPENAEAFESGSGTESNPFIIMTADQLAAFAVSVDEGTTYEGQYIRLGSDIDLSAIETWNPIGDESKPSTCKDKLFNGDFDGAGHTVSGLSITGPHAEWENIGLFSTLNISSNIHDLALADFGIAVSTDATMRAGALAGDTLGNSSGIGVIVDSVSAKGMVNVQADNDSMLFAGGLFGRAMAGAVISNSWTDVSVTAEAKGAGYPSAYAGGLVGMGGNNMAIVNAAAFGQVWGSTPQGDSLVGYAGGLVGMYPGRLWNSYATGDVTYDRLASSLHTWAGALAGQMTTKASADHVYHALDSAITLEAWEGDSYTTQALTGASGSSTKNTSFLTIEPAGTFPLAEMTGDSFADTLNANMQSVFNQMRDASLADVFTLRTWVVSDGRVVPAGDFWYNDQPDTGVFASGTGTENDPYIIETADQMSAFAASLGEKLNYDGYFIALGADIDLSGADWTPVGLGEYGFAGTFDGRGYTIRGMHLGTAETPASKGPDQPYFALFGVLERTAVVKNVNLTEVFVNASWPASSYVAGIAGYMASVQDDSRAGAWIDNCHVSGQITTVQDNGNLFIGGIAAYQYKGAITNCSTDMDLSGTVLGEALAEVGGIAALVNRGLVANSYALCNVYGSGNRENDLEGMAVVSSLVAVDAGDVVGCYGSGDNTTKEFSNYAGMVSGWVTGIGKAYSCWYNSESVMTVNGSNINPPETIGTKVPAGVSEDEMVYSGGVVDDLKGYTAQTYASVADALNNKFTAYPIEITQYGIPADALSKWVYTDQTVTFSGEKQAVTYVQPAAEQYVKPEAALRDGVWYGRDQDKTTVVRITVAEGAVTETEVLSGAGSGEAYEAALETAKTKGTYGDFSHYEAADPSRFGGGKGTQGSPYLIKNAEQLQYLAWSINEDTDWEGVWFRQTADISLEGIDWIPIGWALEAEINNQEETVCAYPFCGCFDGGGYTISGLTVGSAEAPSGLMTAALFGLTSGEYTTNEAPTDDVRRVVLKDIHLRDAAVYADVRYQLYAGTLAGTCQYGVEIDNCDATGIVQGVTADSHCRAGGLIASGLRGRITNSWTDVTVNAYTDTGRAYGAGIVATSNRLTIVNVYSLGDVYGGSSSSNMTFLGGIDGMEGGVHLNCYSSGNITSSKATSGIGAINGLVGGISLNKACYYNSDSTLTAAGSPAEMKASGANYSNVTDEAFPKTYAEITGEEFAQLLNTNAAGISQLLDEVRQGLDLERHALYYTGDGSDLARWAVIDGAVRFTPGTQEITVSSPVFDVTYGDKPFNIGAKAKTALTYVSDNASVAAVNANGKVTVGNAGTAKITISAAANTQYSAAENVTVTVNVAKAASSVTLKAKTVTYNGKAAAIGKASVKGSTGKITYKYYSDSKCATQVKSAVNAGTYYAKAFVAADKNYKSASSKAVKLTISKAATKATLKNKTVTYNGKTIDPARPTVTGSKGKITYRFYSDSKCKKAVKGHSKAGTYYVKADVKADKNYKAATSNAAKLVIKKAAQKVKTITASATVSASKLKKAAQTVKIKTTIVGKGKVTYAKSSGTKSIKVSKAGTITVAKGLKKGTYTIKVKVAIAGTENFSSASAVKAIKITVK